MAAVMVAGVVVMFVAIIIGCREGAVIAEQRSARTPDDRWRQCPLDERVKCALGPCVTYDICTARFEEEWEFVGLRADAVIAKAEAK